MGLKQSDDYLLWPVSLTAYKMTLGVQSELPYKRRKTCVFRARRLVNEPQVGSNLLLKCVILWAAGLSVLHPFNFLYQNRSILSPSGSSPVKSGQRQAGRRPFSTLSEAGAHLLASKVPG